MNENTAKRKKQKKNRDPYDGLRPWSAITHGIGAVLALFAGIALLIKAQGDTVALLSFAIYALSMVVLYTASCLYHSLNTSIPKRLALRKLDHCSIYLLIAGSYTPICLVALKGTIGAILISVIWIFAAVGIVLTLVKLDIPRWVCTAIYIIMGWLAIFAISPLSKVISTIGLVWLITGGIIYTIGGVLYAVKWPGRDNPKFGCHEIFHVFILLGSVCHFMLMYTVIAI